jgi:NDP-sugar pyrophosphorylase family protein
MEVFVLGAGLGKRLRPLTEVRPKPLVPVCNRPLITYAFDHLIAHGFSRFIVNTHWLAGEYAREFPENTYRGRPITFRHEPEILETAGGIKNVEDLLQSEDFLVYNGDILTDLPLAPVLHAHRAAGNEVTMVLRSKDGPLQISFDRPSGRVTDIGNRLGATQPEQFLFTGLYVVNRAFLARIPAAEKIGVVPIFLKMIQETARLGGVVIDDGHWWDLGERAQYLAVHRHFDEDPARPSAPWLAPGAEMAGDVTLSGACAVGAHARIGAGAQLADSIVWPGAVVEAGADLRDCIVTGRAPVAGTYLQADL